MAKDNAQFVQDKNLFDHGYFGFMWQVCCFVPTTIVDAEPQAELGLDDVNLSYLQVRQSWLWSSKDAAAEAGLRARGARGFRNFLKSLSFSPPLGIRCPFPSRCVSRCVSGEIGRFFPVGDAAARQRKALHFSVDREHFQGLHGFSVGLRLVPVAHESGSLVAPPNPVQVPQPGEWEFFFLLGSKIGKNIDKIAIQSFTVPRARESAK